MHMKKQGLMIGNCNPSAGGPWGLMTNEPGLIDEFKVNKSP